MASKKKGLPALIIIGHPDLPKGEAELTCGQCNVSFPAQMSTALTVAQLGAAAPPIVCFGCYQTLAAPQIAHLPLRVIGNKETRKHYGLDN